MADTKLSALTELAATPADTDEIYIRDVSEAEAAESKRITLANLLASKAELAHKTRHQNGGADEISVAGLSGQLADDQHIVDAEAKAASVQAGAITNGGTKAPTHDAVYDVKVTADAAQTAAEVDADITTHNNVANAHGAVSAATASKIVVRDAQGQAAFAAPAAAGDALIKGTRVTTAELPAMTDEKYWVGTGATVEERAVPTGGASLTVAQTEVYADVMVNTWTDLDLSGTVGSQATLVFLKVSSQYGNRMIAVRKNGDTDEFYAVTTNPAGASTGEGGGAGHYITFLVATDTSGVIEWRTEDDAHTCTIDIIAYIK